MIRSIIFSSIIINLGLLLGRLTGFIREVFIASEFGVSADADILIFILTIPDLLVNILVGGGLAAALIPEFINNKSQKGILLFQSLFTFLILSVLLVFLLAFFKDYFIRLFVPGFTELQFIKASGLYEIVVWVIPLTVLSGIFTAYLHAHDYFFSASMGTLVVNASIIIGLLLTNQYGLNLYYCVFFVLIGGLLRTAFQYFEIQFCLPSISFSINPWLINKDIIKRYTQVAFSGSLMLCFPIIIRALSTNLGDGYLASFNYSMKLVELPQVLFLGFITIVLFPKMASSLITNYNVFLLIASWGFRITLLLSSFAVVFMYSLSDLIVELVFGYGKMDVSNINSVSNVFEVLIFSLPFIGLTTYLMVVFNAMNKTKVPVMASVISLLFMVLSVFIFSATLEVYAAVFIISYLIAFLICLIALYVVDEVLLFSIIDIKWVFIVLVESVLFIYTIEFFKSMFFDSLILLALTVFSALVYLLLFFITVPEFRAFLKNKVIIND